jgi:hypothetical protein
MIRTISRLGAAVVLVSLAMSGGCRKGSPAIEMHGAVTCNGETISAGRVTFVPLDANERVCAAPIVDGQYRIADRGGVPVGKYRVQIDARKKTGRQAKGFNGVETTMVDEETPLGPKKYRNQNSPLRVEVRSDSDGVFDIAIPRE